MGRILIKPMAGEMCRPLYSPFYQLQGGWECMPLYFPMDQTHSMGNMGFSSLFFSLLSNPRWGKCMPLYSTLEFDQTQGRGNVGLFVILFIKPKVGEMYASLFHLRV